MKKWCVLLMSMLCGLWLIPGCEDRPAATNQTSAQADALPAGLVIEQAPEGAREVADVRKAADGDVVVVRGRIGGQRKPFTAGRAQFQLVDLAVSTCDKMPDDHCPTPWDMCCEPTKDIADNSVTVQVVGAGDRPLRAELSGVGGMKPMSEIAVKGVVKKSADGKAVMVNATQIHVKQG